jgi:hypothetical protein
MRHKINAMLSAEQQRRYMEIVASETGRVGGASGSGRVFIPGPNGPKEVRLRTGLSDGNATEILGTGLGEGDEVIVGTTQAARAQRPGGAPPRLPF